MFKRTLKTPSLAMSAVIAALYAALTLLLAPISYGPIQCRISEAMTLLPVLLPESIPGLTLGCLIANLLGSATPWDMVFGTFATLLAAVGTRAFRNQTVTRLKIPVLSALCPVLSNAVIGGAVLALTLKLPIVMTMLEVGAGELAAVILGVVLLRVLQNTNALEKYESIKRR